MYVCILKYSCYLHLHTWMERHLSYNVNSCEQLAAPQSLCQVTWHHCSWSEWGYILHKLFESETDFKMTVFWNVMPYSLVSYYRCFRWTSCLHHQGKLLSWWRLQVWVGQVPSPHPRLWVWVTIFHVTCPYILTVSSVFTHWSWR